MVPSTTDLKSDTGDLVEQHPELAITLSVAAIAMLLPELWLLRQVLRMFGFGAQGPIKGTFIYDCNTERFLNIMFCRRSCCVVARVVIWSSRPKGWLVCDTSAPSHEGCETLKLCRVSAC
jgi:hypothetical protein